MTSTANPQHLRLRRRSLLVILGVFALAFTRIGYGQTAAEPTDDAANKWAAAAHVRHERGDGVAYARIVHRLPRQQRVPCRRVQVGDPTPGAQRDRGVQGHRGSHAVRRAERRARATR